MLLVVLFLLPDERDAIRIILDPFPPLGPLLL